MDLDVGKHPKVFGIRQLHIFTPEELHSSFFSLTYKLKTQNAPHGFVIETLDRTGSRPNFVTCQGDGEVLEILYH